MTATVTARKRPAPRSRQRDADEEKSSRAFSKKLVMCNTCAAWAAIFLALYTGAPDVTVPAMAAMIAGLFAAYSGVGHMDYRAFLDKKGDSK